ncbi:hypothetical protein NDU88_006090 [Pleurodeles waltl]|uniref:Uncharacterized protein n=1 Tax=Pleurodeles waltl TaxID=8319 RepID=A0AAV7L2R5_PLEWA|nr:hypothetical protein NDU88_006090 [Pleurodeles waltl]
MHSRAENHKDMVRSALKSCGSQGHAVLCTQELRITRTRYIMHSRAADHKDTMNSALKSCGSQGHSA